MTAGIGNILDPLENILRHVLVWLHESAGFSWAWSIVALTVMVRILLVPLMVRQNALLPKRQQRSDRCPSWLSRRGFLSHLPSRK